ncbi:MAG: phosphoribosylformimino-5-aminoimidazole carboxamide ribotide isomerase [Lachnospiraceae bacterium]
MEFRPCIDIHNGKIKQIVGSSLKDQGDHAEENFVSEQDGAFYAEFYKKDGIKGGHIVLLNSKDSEYYEKTKEQALLALRTWPGGFQVGGGITAENAQEFLDAGASHCIVTSYVFKDGQVNYANLEKLQKTIGKEHLVIDLSARWKDDAYYVVTDRWQNFTKQKLGEPLLEEFSAFCDEFLIHAVDVEGKASGVDVELIRMLERCKMKPITYAGGVSSWEDLELIKKYGRNRIHVTIGSALDLFGGSLPYTEVLKRIKESE